MIGIPLLLALGATAWLPQEAAPAPAIAYHAAWIYAQPEAAPLADAFLVVGGGRVLSVTADREALPPLTPVVELGDRVVFPGLVAADSTVTGVSGQGDHALGAQRRALDDFDPWADMDAVLRRGVTTLYLSPARNRLVGGRGAVVKSAGERRVLRAESDLRVCLTPAAFRPPAFFRPPIPPTTENPIRPSEIQPASSLPGALLVLREQPAPTGPAQGSHFTALRAFLEEGRRLRVAADRVEEIRGALEVAATWKLPLLVDGGAEADRLHDELRETGAGVVFHVPLFLGTPDRSPDQPLADPSTVAALGDLPLALAVGPDGRWTWLLEAAATAVGAGLDPGRALAGISSEAARLLGVDGRVGSLAPGHDADFLVLSAPPLDPGTSVLQVYVEGARVWDEAAHVAEPGGVVLRAGTVWTGDGPPLRGGAEVLIQGSRIVAVASRVPHPPGARVVDAGAEAVITPGFLDARSVLGLDRSSVDPAVLLGLLGAGRRWDPNWQSVARAGVTTLVPVPRSIAGTGTRTQAVKTGAVLPEEAYVQGRDLVYFSLVGGDRPAREESLRKTLERGKKYFQKWEKYRAERKKWEEEHAAKVEEERADREAELRKRLAGGGESTEAAAKNEKENPQESEDSAEESDQEKEAVDPVNGLWEATIEDERLGPDPVRIELRMNHEGSRLVVQVSSPDFPDQGSTELQGDYQDGSIHLELSTEIGTVMIDGQIDAEDHMTVTVSLTGIGSLDFEAVRTERGKVAAAAAPKQRKKKDDGPQEPNEDFRMEGLRSLFEGRGKAVVAADRADEIRAAVRIFSDFELPLAILGGAEADQVAPLLRAHGVGVIVSARLVQRKDHRDHVPAAELAALGVPVAFQSGAATGSRFLPAALSMATRYGLGADQALRGSTSDAARILGIDAQVGTLAPGKDADLVIHSGPPFDLRSHVLRVFVAGREVPAE